MKKQNTNTNEIKEQNDGLQFIIELLNEVKNITNVNSTFYDKAKFIYRGITKFYPYGDNSKGVKKPKIDKVESDYIRSALSVRLSNTKKSYPKLEIDNSYTRVCYTHVLQNMIQDAKKHYPQKYSEEMSDLDILADIQHNGGATCLVDFSKNFLTALWFACSSDFDSDGFVYCYNIMEDMIVNDNLTFIKNNEEKLSIDLLLAQTYRETNVSSDIDTRFCLWEPSPRNNRILRQDSIFMFGIEKFSVKDHCVQVVKIPSNKKRPLLVTMEALFNINESTIYNDYIGYANTNKKRNPYHAMSSSVYERGYSDMIKGNYTSALDFFKLYEGNSYKEQNKKMSPKEAIELHFSLAVCYKYLTRQNGEVSYSENALLEYKDVINITKKHLQSQNINSREKDYYMRKCSRAYNGTIDILYATDKYQQGIDVCDKLIYEITDGVLKNDIDSKLPGKKDLKSRYCRIVKMELLDLIVLSEMNNCNNDYTVNDKYVALMEKYYEEAKNESDITYFDNLLIEYYKLIFNICREKEIKNEYKLKMIELREELTSCNASEDTYRGYILWNFKEIKKAIEKLNDVTFRERKYYLQYATAHIISFRDIFEVQCCRNLQES